MNERRCPFCFEQIPRDLTNLKPILNPHPYCSTAYELPCGHYIQSECRVAKFEHLCYRSKKQLERNSASKPVILIKRAEDPKFDNLWCRKGEWQYVNVCVHLQRKRREGCVKCWIGKFFLKEEPKKVTLIKRRKR